MLAAAAVLVLTLSILCLDIATGGTELPNAAAAVAVFLTGSVPVLLLLRRAGEAAVVGVAAFGVAMKLLGTLARYDVINRVYGGVGDATAYDFYGAQLAREFRSFDFLVDTQQRVPGTGSVRYLTGLVYALFGSSQFVGFFVFSLFSLWGIVFFYLAFATAVPDGDRWRYARLLFLWPSLLFWPSSIGKEAAIIFGLGLSAWGGARIYRAARGGIPLVTLGTTALLLIRPHVALLVFVALFVGYLLRPRRSAAPTATVAKVGGIVALVLVGFLLTAQVERFFGVDTLDATSLDGVLEGTQDRTTGGSSEFEAARVRTPADLPLATVTVLFRPLPTEVRNTTMALSALEGLALALLLAASWRSLLRSPRFVREAPYVAMVLVFALLFIVAFSSIANFGILARQRVQLLPLLFVLASLPTRSGGRRRDPQPDRPTVEPWRTTLWATRRVS